MLQSSDCTNRIDLAGVFIFVSRLVQNPKNRERFSAIIEIKLHTKTAH